MNKLSRFVLNKLFHIIIISFAFVLSANAAHYKSATDKPSHYLSLSLSGGEGNTLTYFDGGWRSGHIKNMAGANANFTFAYEIQNHGMFVNFGLTAEYYATRQCLRDTLLDSFSFSGGEFIYCYPMANESQRNLAAGVPIQVGYTFKNNFYMAANAKLVLNLIHKYDVNADMYTIWDARSQGCEMPFDGSKSVETLGEEGNAGVCPPRNYQSKGDFITSDLNLAFGAELGYQFPLPDKVKDFKLRMGAYFEYSMPVPSLSLDESKYFGDYSKLGKDYSSQTLSMLQEKMIIPSMLNNARVADYHHRMAVGVKLTFLFDVTNIVYPCNCNSGRTYHNGVNAKKMASYRRQERIR